MENNIDRTLELPETWYWTEQDLSIQLQIEIGPEHFLKGKIAKTIARRQDNDDVLFEIEKGKIAVVHLTWQNFAHKNSLWPTTEIYDNWQDVYENRILNDVKEFE